MSAPRVSGRVSVGDLGRGRDVRHGPQRVGRGLDPHQLGDPRAHRGLDGGRVGHVDQLDVQAPARGEVHQPVAQRPVHDLGREHVVPRRQGLKHRRGRGHAGGEQRRLRAFFELRHHGLGLVEGGVVGTGVDAARAVLVVGVTQVGRGDVDGRRDGAGLFIHPAQGLGGDAFGFDAAGVHVEVSRGNRHFIFRWALKFRPARRGSRCPAARHCCLPGAGGPVGPLSAVHTHSGGKSSPFSPPGTSTPPLQLGKRRCHGALSGRGRRFSAGAGVRALLALRGAEAVVARASGPLGRHGGIQLHGQ